LRSVRRHRWPPYPCDSRPVFNLPLQHTDEHRPERPVLLAVDQQLGESAALRLLLAWSELLGSGVSGLGCRNSRTGVLWTSPKLIVVTGFHPGLSWIDLPVLGVEKPLHRSGIVEAEPGLFFSGLNFLHSVSCE
jgi:hypothetical protein